ncbi:MAG: hypothetical protein JSU95_16810 [Betaproteobacteria bacterium]|nr:MAG: hypothetical protein JSU95_16810 [Betaproteobacteria bacterium]
MSGVAKNLSILYLFLGLSAASMVVMMAVDLLLGARAEFLNAYSVAQRVLGQAPTVGESLVAREFGAEAELIFVVVANLIIGGVVTVVVRYLAKQ